MKLLIMSNFFICHNVFLNLFNEYNSIYRKFPCISPGCIQSRLPQICCMWERVKSQKSSKTFLSNFIHLDHIALMYKQIFINIRQAPVAQLVALRGVNSGVESSNHSSANILSDVWQKSLWQASFFYHQWANILCGKVASCLERLLCGLLVWC